MSKAFPTTFYHSISQSRLKSIIHEDALPGLSRFHLDPNGRNPGVWLTNKLGLVSKNKYGEEQSDEIIDTWDAEFMAKITGKPDASPLVIKETIPGIILELTGLDENKLIQHPLLPDQFFYGGNIDWKKIKDFLVREHDTNTETSAQSLADTLKNEKGVEIGVKTFQPLDYLENEPIQKELINNTTLEGERRI